MAEDKGNPAQFFPGEDPAERELAEEDASHRTHFRLIILGVVIALSVGYMIYATFPGNVRYFLTVSEFMGGAEYQDGRVLRVAGTLVPDSFRRAPEGTLAYFRLVDKEGEAAGGSLHASYVGVMPDLFFNPHSEIILEGSYGKDSVFETDNILVKCPSKYQSLEAEPPDDYNNYNDYNDNNYGAGAEPGSGA